MANKNVGRLENGAGESAELMAQSGAYSASHDEVRSLGSEKKLWRFSIRDFIL